MRRLATLLVPAVLVVLVAGGACTDSPEPGAAGRTPEPPRRDQPISFTVAALNVEAGQPPAPQAVEQAKSDVQSSLNGYLEVGVLGPLRTGGPAGDIGPVFTAAARERLGGPDRAALVDEGLPAVEGLRADRAVLEVTVFADQGGQVVMASAGFDLKMHGTVQGTPFSVDRTGEFLLLPDNGAWRIDGYQVRAARETAGMTTTSTAQR